MRILIFSALAMFAVAANANECKFSAERKLDINPNGLQALAFNLGSSDLHVQGVAGLAQIEVIGKACASEQDRLSGLTVTQQRDGDVVTVTPNQAGERSFRLFGSSYAYIDLDVRVPTTLPIRVRTHSGDATIADVAALDFDSHSGDLILDRSSGAVGVSVHSGDVKAQDIGALEVRRSGSGDVQASRIHGAVEIGHVGSGDLRFDDVDQGVHVQSVGSGDVSINRAGANVTIDAIGSGDVSVANVGGDFTVKSAGSGDIHHRNVKGRVDVPRRDDD
ncbi:MAG: DUF4097 family beta strand repeat-containing protein [Rudaea sp.]